MNHILRHTLAVAAAKNASGYVSSPLRSVGSTSRALGLQVARGVGGA